MTRCDHCSVRIEQCDAITNRRGTFCTTDCDERNRRDSWQLADPPDHPEAELVQPSLPQFCYP